MSIIIFETYDAIFQFEYKAVMLCLEHRKSSYENNELDTLIKLLANQPENAKLSSEQHRYFGFIVLEDLIDTSGQGSVVCKNCGKQYRFNQLEAFTVGPDDATFKAATAKKNLFREKPKPFGIYGGKGYKCPEGHELIFQVAWRT
jgi:hypothetical protein